MKPNFFIRFMALLLIPSLTIGPAFAFSFSDTSSSMAAPTIHLSIRKLNIFAASFKGDALARQAISPELVEAQFSRGFPLGPHERVQRISAILRDQMVLWAVRSKPGHPFYTVKEIIDIIVKRVTTISPERKSWWDSVDRLLSQRLIEKDDKPTGRIPQFRERTQDVFDETEQDPALIDLEWRNVSANRLPYYESFRHHDGLDMMPFIFGPAAKFPNKKEAAEGTVGDILTAYGFLRTTTDLSGKARRWEIAALFSELQPSLAVIENPDQLQKGLEWLEIQHMPIRQNRLFKKGILSRYWLMNGLARQHFASLDAAGFNPTLKNRWIANTVSESPNQPWFVPNADSRRRAKTNIDLVLARMRLQKRSVMSIYHTLDFWGRSKQPRALDGSLEEMAAKIGAEAALLRWNISRYLARQRITARLEELTVGEGIRALRRAAGLSPGSLAVAIGVDRRTLTKWELGERRVSNAYDRQALSAVLEAGAKWFDGSRTPLPRVLLDAAS